MNDACVIAIGAVSGLGVGRAAFSAGEIGERARVAIARDGELEAAGLARPFVSRVRAELGFATGDRATDLLLAALAPVLAELERTRPGFRKERLGLALGTSSGGMLTSERFFAARASGTITPEIARGATYFAPVDAALAEVGLERPPLATHVLAACAASTIAIGIGLRWLDRGACDLVLAGGYDAVSVFVAAGFEALRATTASSPKPFRIGRDGMSLGEGAGLVALVREADTRGAPILARIAGFGASMDAVHITAPDRTGGGLARAACAALADAGVASDAVGLVSAHATATPFNDPMESKAIQRSLVGTTAIVHPFKAQIGHTLGAAGVLEALAAADSLARGLAPAAAGEGPLDPDAPACLLERAEPRELSAALKLSAAFGGTNAALVLTRARSGRARRGARAVYLHASARITSPTELTDLHEKLGIARDRLGRLDTLTRFGLAAVARLAEAISEHDAAPPSRALAGAGVVVGHALATIETNDLFDARKRARGATLVEPRLFPATSPNAIAGECAIAFQLTGPGFAVGAGLDGGLEALLDAAELVAAGDAERMVVVAADDAGPAARALAQAAGLPAPEAGAVALLLTASPEGAVAEVPLDWSALDHATAAPGHRSLVAWLERISPAARPS